MFESLNPLVSVIIPAYNSEQYLSETLASIFDQTYKNIEIIVVDDGSVDGTLREAKKFEAEGVKVLSQGNKGACVARNLGFKHAKGEFIQFLDADDLIASNKIELQVNLLIRQKDYETKMVHCRWGRFYNSIMEDIVWGPHALIQRDLLPIDWLLAGHMSATHCWLTPRALIEKAGLWDEKLLRNQDGEFFSRLVANAKEVLYCEPAKVYYRSGIGGSVSQFKSEKTIASTLLSHHLVAQHILGLEQSDRVNRCLANRYLSFAQSFYMQYPNIASEAKKRSAEYGGGNVKLQGGVALKILEMAFGWEKALFFKKKLEKLVKLRGS